MKNAEITKLLKKSELQDLSMSIGFRRYLVLPNRVKINIQTSYLLKTNKTNWHDKTIEFFKNMTEKEYINWLRLA